jgi:DNA-binding winged helix-turn-helix (wHTH) protein/Tol biopolymer transport system component
MVQDVNRLPVALHPSVKEVRFGPFLFDRVNRILMRGDEEISLPPRALGILEYLLERRGEVVSKHELMDVVWRQSYVSDTSLTEAVSLLRQSLGDSPQDPRYIQTVHRRGYRFVADIQIGSTAQSDEPGESEPPGDRSQGAGRYRFWVGLAAAMSLVAAFFVGRTLRPPVGETIRFPTRFTIPLPAGSAIVSYRPSLALSPDGRNLVFVAKLGDTVWLFRRSLDSMTTERIGGTEDAYAPFISPDGRWIGFFTSSRLKRVAMTGGPVFEICYASKGAGASWGEDGRIVFAGDPVGGLLRVPAEGGRPEVLTTPDYRRGELAHCWPEILPGNELVLFTIWSTTVHSARIAALDLDTGEIRGLVEGATGARYAADGHLLYSQSEALVSSPFDPNSLQLKDTARVVVEGISVLPERGHAQFAVARNGTLVYLPGDLDTAKRELVEVGEDGALAALPFEDRFFRNIDVSHGSRKAAVTILDGSRSDVWVTEIDRGPLRRLTFEGFNIEPAWSSDGKWVAFASNRNGAHNIYLKAADGSGEARRLLESELHQYPESWAPDGKMLLFNEYHPETGSDLWLVAINEDGSAKTRPQPLRTTPANDMEASFSPDGRWITYSSDESGRWEVYVQSVPSDGGKWQVSTDGGGPSFWSADGGAVVYRDGVGLVRVPVTFEPELRLGTPEVVVERDDIVRVAAHPDGGKLIAIREVEGSASTEDIHVVLNWSSEG